MTFFEFVVRRGRWLARIPGLPHYFDAMLLLWTAVRHRDRLRAMEAVEAAALKIPRITLCVHRFGGTGFALNGRELAHIHGNGLLDVRTGKPLARALIAAGRAEPHHVFGDSAWIGFWIRSEADVAAAVALFEAAAAVRDVATE